MNNKLRQALNNLSPEALLAYRAGKLPPRMAIAMSHLTYWEQNHMQFSHLPGDVNTALTAGLIGDDGKPVEISEDRKPLFDAVVTIFMEDQESVRLTGKISNWGEE